MGTADLPSSLTVEDPALDEHRRITVPWLTQVPVSIPLRGAGVTGVAGQDAANLAGWMAAQAAALHSPADLRILVLAGPDGENDWSWVRWLPHCQPQTRTPTRWSAAPPTRWPAGSASWGSWSPTAWRRVPGCPGAAPRAPRTSWWCSTRPAGRGRCPEWSRC